MSQENQDPSIKRPYLMLLYLVAGFGGLLYGIDVGIVAGALPYINQTISLSALQASMIVAAVLAGSVLSTPVAGIMAEWLGRRVTMLASALMFIVSILLIIASQHFLPLLLGRLLQGIGAGFISVVVPLFIVETVDDEHRGRATTMFQFLLAAGIAIAALLGQFFTSIAEHKIEAAQGNQALIEAAASEAWHHMFLVALVPGTIFALLVLIVAESPRWLLRRGKQDKARNAIARLLHRVDEHFNYLKKQIDHQAAEQSAGWWEGIKSLRQKRYIVPFVLACLVLALNQATGINSLLAYLVVILQQAGLPPLLSSSGDVIFKTTNLVLTVVAFILVDRWGRKALLCLGTAGATLALVITAGLFLSSEHAMKDASGWVRADINEQGFSQHITPSLYPQAGFDQHTAKTLTLVYRLNTPAKQGELHIATTNSTSANPVMNIKKPAGQSLEIYRATFGDLPSETHGWLTLAALCLYAMAFAVGPGVVVWLVLTELMPNRIRAVGIGIGLFLNNATSTALATIFLPVAGQYGMSWNFMLWAVCTLVYFVIAWRFIPETKGRSLEEIEEGFAARD